MVKPEERRNKRMNEINDVKEKERKHLNPVLTVFVVCLLSVLAALFLAEGCSFLYYFEALSGYARTASPIIAGGSFLCFLVLEGIGAGLLAEVFCANPRAFYPHLSAFAAYGSALLALWWLCGTWLPIEAMLSLVFYFSGFFLFRARAKKSGKTESVLWASVPAMLLIALAVVLMALVKEGMSASFLSDYIGRIREDCSLLAENLTDMFIEMSGDGQALLSQMISWGYLPQDASIGTMREYFFTAFESFCMLALLLLPSVLVCACNGTGYLAASLLALVRSACGEKEKWRLSVSSFGIGAFVVTSIFTAFVLPLGLGGALAVIFLNLMIIYMPLMMALGVRALLRLKWRMIAEHKVLAVVTLIFFFMNPLLMLAMIGAYAAFSEKMLARNARMGDQDKR